MLTLKELKPTRFGFGEGLKEAGERNKNLVGLGADITGSVSMNLFAEAFPDRFFSLGIAEQNIIGVAAGMSLSGKIPVMATYGVFSALRTTDQIRVSVCYNNLHVIIGGAHAGISVGPDGATHQALEDIAIMRVLPRMTVLSPCDATQTKLATIAAVEKINAYRRFFSHCHRWLRPEGCISLQTIAYGNAGPSDIAPFIAEQVFPESDLPRLAEIAGASHKLFEFVNLRNDRLHYTRTLKEWMGRLKACRQEAVELVGEEKVALFERYLRLSGRIFQMGTVVLYRIALRRIDRPRLGDEI